MNSAISDHNLRHIRYFTAIASLLLSFQAVYFDDIINRDGIMYLQQAEAYLTGGLALAKTIYDWPAFSMIVAWVHTFTALPLELSGFLTNSFFFIVLTDAFVLISSLLVSSKRQLVSAAVLILCFMPVNEYRDFILRDPGYWAFSTLALYHFLVLFRSASLSSALLWQLFMGIAILFRIEGAVILLLMPFSLFFYFSFGQALRSFLRAYSLVIVGLGGLALILTNESSWLEVFGKATSIFRYVQFESYINLFTQHTDLIKLEILNRYSEDYAGLILISGILAMLAYKLLKTFSVSYLVVYAVSHWTTQAKITSPFQGVLIYFFGLNILILLAFLFKEYFISSRYTVLALIGLLLLVLPKICHAIDQLLDSKRKLPLFFIGFALFYSIADTSTLSTSKIYIKENAQWAAQHIPADSLVITDDEFILHYFDTHNTTSTLCVKPIFEQTAFLNEYAFKMPYTSGVCATPESNDYRHYDYLVVVEKRRHKEYKTFIETLDLELIHRQSSKKGDHASVYKVIK